MLPILKQYNSALSIIFDTVFTFCQQMSVLMKPAPLNDSQDKLLFAWRAGMKENPAGSSDCDAFSIPLLL